MRLFFKPKNKILILWYSDGDNLGDYYLYKTVCNYAKNSGFNTIGVDVGLPFDVIAKYAKRCNFMWFAGGGIIERGVPDIIRNFNSFIKLVKNIKYGITGLSIGNFNYDEYKDAISCFVNNSSFFYTRDKYSADELNRLSDSNIVKESADVVFAYDIPKNYAIEEKYFGINFRELPYTDLSGEFNWTKWNESINKLEAKTIIGIPDQHDISKKVIFSIDTKYTPEKALSIISQCEYTLSMRYHAILLAARLGKLSLPICYCPKVERLADQLNLSDLKLGVHDYDLLVDKYNQMLNNKLMLKDEMNKKVMYYEKEAKKMFLEVSKYLKENIYV